MELGNLGLGEFGIGELGLTMRGDRDESVQMKLISFYNSLNRTIFVYSSVFIQSALG